MPKKRSENYEQQKNRLGRVAVAGYFDPEVRKQLKIVGAEQARDIQDMLSEALNDFFLKYKKKPICPVKPRE